MSKPNPFEIAQKQLDDCAKILNLEPGVHEVLRRPRREFHVSIPVRMDDGSIKVFQGAIESLAAAEPRGLGVRMVEGGRVGYAYTGDLSPAGIDGVLLAAADNARAADPDVFLAASAS